MIRNIRQNLNGNEFVFIGTSVDANSIQNLLKKAVISFEII